MSLRIHDEAPPSLAPMDAGSKPSKADDWTSRLAKLIPAEALALYGAGASLVPANPLGLACLALAAAFVAGAVRFVATKDSTGTPQWPAIAIAIVSFVLWLAALPEGANTFGSARYADMAALAALIWTTIIPFFYKGDAVPAT